MGRGLGLTGGSRVWSDHAARGTVPKLVGERRVSSVSVQVLSDCFSGEETGFGAQCTECCH